MEYPVAGPGQPQAQQPAQEHAPPPPKAGEAAAAAEQPRSLDRRDVISAAMSSSSDSGEENIPDERGRNRSIWPICFGRIANYIIH